MKTRKWLTCLLIATSGLISVTAYAEILSMPGTFCQPLNDQDNVSYTNHTYRAYDDVELVCPLFNTDHFRDTEIAVSTARIRVYDAENNDRVSVDICRDISSSSTGAWCGSTVSTGDSFTGWNTLTLNPPSTSSGARNVYFFKVELPDNSRVHSYEVVR